MSNILLAIGGSAIAVFLILLLIRLRYDRLIAEIWRSLKIEPSGVFTTDMVANLDEPVQRYFLHAIEPRTPLASYVELDMDGSFRPKPSADWLKMRASEIVSTAPGFIWQANIGWGLVSFNGSDFYSYAQARTKFFWGLIPIVDAGGNNVERSAAGRLGAEYIWLPSALLPDRGVAWEAIANNTIQANFKIGREYICLTLTIDKRGRLLEISLPRWGNANPAKSWQYSTFIANVTEEVTFDGYTVPAKMNAGWLDRHEYRLFFQCNLKQAHFL